MHLLGCRTPRCGLQGPHWAWEANPLIRRWLIVNFLGRLSQGMLNLKDLITTLSLPPGERRATFIILSRQASKT